MSKWNPGKHGVPVLAYVSPEPLSLCCSLRIQHHEPRAQVTLMLRTTVALHGADEQQAFVAQYDADNLLPMQTAPTMHMPAARLAAIARNPASSQLTTLALRLKQPCPLWCPRLDALLPAPEPPHVAVFGELVLLAKATTVHIVVDYNWLSLDQRVPFQRILTGKAGLTGFPVADYYARHYRRADWTVFAPAVSSKRAVASPSSPPPYKRRIVEKPGGEAVSDVGEPVDDPVDEQLAASPTDVATSPDNKWHIDAATPPNKSDDGSSPPSEHDFQTRAITRVVQRHLPDVLAAILPAALNHALPTLFALPASFTSSFDSEDSHSETSQPSPLPHPALRPHDLTPLGAALLPHLLAHLAPQLAKLHNASIKKWTDRTAGELDDAADDHSAHLAAVADDGVAQIAREVGYQLDEVRQTGRDVAENVSEEVEDVVRARAERAVGEVRRAIHETQLRAVDGVRRGARRGRYVGKGGFRGVGCR